MHKRFFAISIFILFSLSIASDRDCDGLSQDDCEWLDYCVWTEDGCVRVGDDNGEWEDDEDWEEDECRYFESEDECLAAGCEWDGEDGCYGSWDDEEDWEEEELYCEELTQDECSTVEGCEWTDWGCLHIDEDEEEWEFECEDIDNEEECLEVGCEWTGSSNTTEGFCSGGWDDEEDEEDWECSDLGHEDCIYVDGCEWISDSDNPAAGDGYCVEVDNEDGPPECLMDCEGIENIDPEENGTYFCEWLLQIFPGGCAEDCEQEILDDIEQFMIICDQCLSDNNCDDIFDDSDDYEGCQDSTGEWYDFGYEIFVNDCEYYECTEQGWEGPFTIDSEDCSDNNDWECSDLGYEDCLYYDFCEWVSDPNIGWEGICVDAGWEDDGGDDGGWEPEAAVILGNGSSSPGGEVQIPLMLETAVSVSGIQFTINSSPSDWQTVVDFNAMVSGECFEANFNNTENGTIGLIYSLSGCEFSPFDGISQIGTLTFEISEQAEWGGVIELYFTELIVASSGGEQVDAEGYGGLITIGMVGDVNHDGEINVIDAVTMIQFILQFEDPTEFEFWASDINQDESLNILDVVVLIEMILDN